MEKNFKLNKQLLGFDMDWGKWPWPSKEKFKIDVILLFFFFLKYLMFTHWTKKRLKCSIYSFILTHFKLDFLTID